MKLVSTDQQHQRLTLEIKRLQEELALTQTDRDKLREQFLREENRFSQFKACTAAHQAQEKQRVAQLVEKKMQTIAQTQEKAKRDKDRARRWVFAQSDWMSAFQPCRSLIAGDTGTSLLRPGAAAVSRKHVVEWREVVEIAEPFFQPIATSEGGPTRSITVVKDGIYQVNASVSHDSLVEMRLVITPANETSAARRSTRTIAPTKVSLYDNKRRVSRVDKMLELHALDQLSLELVVLDSSTTPPGLDWLRTPMPSHNRFLIVILDEHALVPK
ncbi:hypothetical protein PHMEG_00021775 [Phytophthora megakarya]|uniref:Uncharacterized protein n=1 Tax=Phytophthora megakarya TaxID=4795 RepID=A0A225VLY7_9STRA|nr:hypothetical protein PHMEG_00021775 [Phytophthora megakarya]